MKSLIEKYKVKGKVYAWTYKNNPNNYPGWNFTVNKTASKSLIELLDLMNKCEWSTKKTIKLEVPTDLQIRVPNNQNGIARWETIPKLTLKHIKKEPENHWLIKNSIDCIEVQFGTNKLIELQNTIKIIPEGKGDFCISNKNCEDILYFWWNLEE